MFLLELLIHRLGDPKCVVSEISGCSDMSVAIRYFMVSVRRTGTFLVYVYDKLVMIIPCGQTDRNQLLHRIARKNEHTSETLH